MKVLHIIAGVDSRGGGPIEALRLSALAMREMDYDAEVVSLDEMSAPWVTSFPFPVHGCGPARIKGRFAPKFSPWIARNAHRFDVAIIHGLWNWASIGGWLGLRHSGLPYVIFTHGMMDPWFRSQYPLKHFAKQILWTAVQGKVLRDARRVLFTCEEEKNLARGVFWGYDYKEKVVAFGAEEPPLDLERQVAAFRAAVPTLGDRPYLLFLSRIHPKKGCDLLVDAFVKLADQYPGIDLVIAGPDQVGLMADLAQRANNAGIGSRIHWPGMLSGAAKWGAFRDAEAFVLPSHQENFGIVVAEAMACHTPVLITNKVNIWREVEATRAGFVATDTPKGIEDMLRRWLALPAEEKQQIRHAARQGFETHFTATAAAKDLAGVLQDVKRGGR